MNCLRKENDMITHILKNGKVIKDITGHVVKEEDAPTVYALMNSLNERRSSDEKSKKCDS